MRRGRGSHGGLDYGAPVDIDEDEDTGDSVERYKADVKVRWKRRSISLSRGTYDRLVAYAVARGESRSKIIEQWIEEALGDPVPTVELLTKQRDDARMYAATLWVAMMAGVGDTAGLGPQMAWDHYAKRWGATEALRVYGERPSRIVAGPGQVAKPAGSLRSGPVTDGDLGDCPQRV